MDILAKSIHEFSFSPFTAKVVGHTVKFGFEKVIEESFSFKHQFYSWGTPGFGTFNDLKNNQNVYDKLLKEGNDLDFYLLEKYFIEIEDKNEGEKQTFNDYQYPGLKNKFQQ